MRFCDYAFFYSLCQRYNFNGNPNNGGNTNPIPLPVDTPVDTGNGVPDLGFDFPKNPVPPVPGVSCDEEKFKYLVGALYDQNDEKITPKERSQNVENLPRNKRILGPHDMATMDYDETRLNIYFNPLPGVGNVITRVKCG